MLTYENMPAGAVLFTHVDDDGTQTVFSIEHVLQAVEYGFKHKVLNIIRVGLDRSFARFCVTSRGIEKHRLKKLPRDPETWDPVIFAIMPDGSHLLIDGHHRYVQAVSKFRRAIKAVMLPEAVWRKCVIVDAPAVDPAGLLAMPSGL